MDINTRKDSGLWLYDSATTSWVELEINQNESDFCISGYPRSGNTFLNTVVSKMYPSFKILNNFHTIKSIQNHNKVFIPIRNPLDCISSWAHYQKYYFGDGYHLKLNTVNLDTVDKDINYYLRFHTDMFNYKNKIKILDFDYFTNDINYIENKINIKKEKEVNLESIKKEMQKTDKKINVPRKNKKDLEEIKQLVTSHPRLKECYRLYNEIRGQI